MKITADIKGYRQLSPEEQVLINEIKGKAVEVGELVAKLTEPHGVPQAYDQRWVSIARTDLQTGFMALVRAVAQPETF